MLFFQSLITLVSLVLVVSAAVAPRHNNPQPSGTPCSYSCPPKDKDGRDIFSQDISNGYLICKYIKNSSRKCVYRRSNGDLKDDYHYDDCKNDAVPSSGCQHKRGLESTNPVEGRVAVPRGIVGQVAKDTHKQKRNARRA